MFFSADAFSLDLWKEYLVPLFLRQLLAFNPDAFDGMREDVSDGFLS